MHSTVTGENERQDIQIKACTLRRLIALVKRLNDYNISRACIITNTYSNIGVSVCMCTDVVGQVSVYFLSVDRTLVDLLDMTNRMTASATLLTWIGLLLVFRCLLHHGRTEIISWCVCVRTNFGFFASLVLAGLLDLFLLPISSATPRHFSLL